MKNLKAVYPGTFDPITLGHMDMIQRTANMFEQVIVAIAADTHKVALFSLEDRIAMAKNEVARMQLTNVTVTSFFGLLTTFATNENARVIVRGIRAVSDFEYEFKMAYVNRQLTPAIETILLPATETGQFISSSFVKEVARLGGDISYFVSPDVAAKLQQAQQK